jgi:hypothetical protein
VITGRILKMKDAFTMSVVSINQHIIRVSCVFRHNWDWDGNLLAIKSIHIIIITVSISVIIIIVVSIMSPEVVDAISCCYQKWKSY